jgi:hypothetical protein
MRDRLFGMHRRHIVMLGPTTITDADLQRVITSLRRLERLRNRATDPFESRRREFSWVGGS